jgi:hypothetical protein
MDSQTLNFRSLKSAFILQQNRRVRDIILNAAFSIWQKRLKVVFTQEKSVFGEDENVPFS